MVEITKNVKNIFSKADFYWFFLKNEDVIEALLIY